MRYRNKSGKHMLIASFSYFETQQTFRDPRPASVLFGAVPSAAFACVRRPFGVIYERRPAETEHKFKQLQSRERVAALSHEAAVPLLRAMDNTGDARICF